MKTNLPLLTTFPRWAALGALLVATPLWANSVGLVCSKVFTTTADFTAGNLVNVNTSTPNELQLNPSGSSIPLPFVYIACSGRGTLVRIDVGTGAVLGEYLTAPDGRARNPSRTTVDKFGNCWVGNRDEFSFSVDSDKGSIARIGLVLGGTRGHKNGDGSFTPDPLGEYLQGPFTYNTCVDRDGDGYIRTSRGLGHVLGWANGGGVNNNGGVSTADDESIINYTRVTGTGTRTIAVDANNDVWVGGTGDLDHEKINGTTGQPVPGTQFNLGAGGYGGLIDGAGVLWSARTGSGLLRFDPNVGPAPGTGTLLGNNCGDYGLGLDPVTGEIWHTFLSGGLVGKIAPNGACLGSFGHGEYYAQGVAVDGTGNVWVAHSLFSSITVGHLRTDGTFVGNVNLGGDGNGPTGVSVDANGKIWVACVNSSTAKRIDPAAGPIGGGGFPVGAVDLTVDLNATMWNGWAASPYNYSDMTGFVLLSGTSSGSWSAVHDSGVAGTSWGTANWTATVPAGTSLDVEVRTAETQLGLAGASYVPVANGVSLCASPLTGRFIEVRVKLARDAGVTATPVLQELSLSCCDGEAPTVEAACTLIPSGRSVLVTANDSGDPNPKIYVQDSASAFVAGPFASGSRLHIRTAPTQTPSSKPAPAPYAARITLKGIPSVYAVDGAGNVSAPVGVGCP
jgi:streptogramin lyase